MYVQDNTEHSLLLLPSRHNNESAIFMEAMSLIMAAQLKQSQLEYDTFTRFNK